MDYSKNPIHLVGSEISDYMYDALYDLAKQGLQINEERLISALHHWFDVHTTVNPQVIATWPHFFLLAKWDKTGCRTMHIVPSIDEDVYDITTESGDDSDITAFDLATLSCDHDRSYDIAMKFELFRDNYEFIVTSDEISRLRGGDFKHSPLRHDIAMSMSTEGWGKAVLEVTKLSAERYGIFIVTPESGDGEEDFERESPSRIIIHREH